MALSLKICGNHSKSDVDISLRSKANYLGFVFAESKRKVTIEDVKNWLEHKRPSQKIVALFVNEKIETIKDTIKALPIDIVQCHGNESKDYITRLKNEIQLPIWKVIHANKEAVDYMASFAGLVDGYIVDCKSKNQWGGTGTSFDWSTIPLYLNEAKKQSQPLLIAGGINPDNVEELFHYSIDGIDLSSGVEIEGKKSMALIEQLVERMNKHENNLSR
ncbi:putative phosphoribosylanthranilate isomerase [Bacillus sp. TS-2]|nr:putative phosphoribosylanthranilate isomerase [Bacillus sp. TS-2]